MIKLKFSNIAEISYLEGILFFSINSKVKKYYEIFPFEERPATANSALAVCFLQDICMCGILFVCFFSKTRISGSRKKNVHFSENSLSGKLKTISSLIVFHRSVLHSHPVARGFTMTFANFFNEWDSLMSHVTKCSSIALTQIRFPIGGERVTYCWSKFTKSPSQGEQNSLRKQ